MKPWPSKSLIHSSLKMFTSTLFEPHSLLTKICNSTSPRTLRPILSHTSGDNLLCSPYPESHQICLEFYHESHSQLLSIFPVCEGPPACFSPPLPARSPNPPAPREHNSKRHHKANEDKSMFSFLQLSSQCFQSLCFLLAACPNPPSLYPTLLKPLDSPHIHS